MNHALGSARINEGRAQPIGRANCLLTAGSVRI